MNRTLGIARNRRKNNIKTHLREVLRGSVKSIVMFHPGLVIVLCEHDDEIPGVAKVENSSTS